MASIFDLKTDVSELKSGNQGVSKTAYEQMPPTRDITGASFSGGDIHMKFEVSGEKWWLPSKTYIRTRFKITDGNDGAIDLHDDLAPNMGMMATLFQSAEFRINDKPVSKIDDFMPQIDALETRLTKSKSWIDSVGASTNYWQDSFRVRQADLSSDGVVNDDVVAESTTVDTEFNDYTAATTVAFTAATGVITFAVAGGNTDVGWAVGDYIVLTTSTDIPSENVRAKVLAVNANLTMTVECVWPANLAADAAIRFSRIRTTSTSDNKARAANIFELTWQPPLSIFKVGHALPSGNYELILRPQVSSAYQIRAMESISVAKTPLPPTSAFALANVDQFRLNVVDMYLYIATVNGPRADDITYLLDLEQTRCQAEVVSSANFSQKSFDVSPSTFALTVAYGDTRAGTDTRISASKFKVFNAAVTASDEELKLTRMFVNYAGVNKPQPDADPAFVAGTDNTAQRYTETQINSGAYYDTGGAESIEAFHSRGSYYHFTWNRDGTDRSRRVTVHQAMPGASIANTQVMLFDHSRQVARVRVQDGRITNVDLEDA